MRFTDVLAKNNLKEDDLSVRIKGDIKRLRKIQLTVDEVKADLPKATEKRRAAMEQEIARGEEAMAQMDAEIEEKILKFIANAEANKKRAEHLRNTAKKRKEKTSEGQDNPTGDVGDDNDPVPEPQPTPQPAGVDPSGDDEGKKKGGVGTVLGVIGGAIALGVLGYFGFKMTKNSD